ncbi:hypothetical protein [Elioraea rosea]|uniref:hypothetical protein n=1 Tax=Elioraea rosea TaxID=2492390 RepID=UPI0011840167|nr:hypothetical protein [Elioraea rosea]
MSGFTVVAHADWSGARTGAAAKRQVAVARREGHVWRLAAPEPVGDPAVLAPRLHALADGGAALLALDVPIGLPRRFAEAHLGGFGSFPAWLDALGPASPFLSVAATLDDVSPARPFFPLGAVSGPGLKAGFLARLGLDDAALLRACDRAGRTANGGRIARACGIFWTVGGNQVGKAALSAWAELLVPARREGLRLWPFEGSLAALASAGALGAAEAYPAEGYARLGFSAPSRKRTQAWRKAQAGAIEAWCARHRIVPAPALAALIGDGFGPRPDGEDAFDATVGALAAIAVASGADPEGTPDDPAIRTWEGWMLGRADQPA